MALKHPESATVKDTLQIYKNQELRGHIVVLLGG